MGSRGRDWVFSRQVNYRLEEIENLSLQIALDENI